MPIHRCKQELLTSVATHPHLGNGLESITGNQSWVTIMRRNMQLRLKSTLVLKGIILLSAVGSLAQAQPTVQIKDVPDPAEIPLAQFGKLHKLIKPQPGELRFHEVPWLIDVWDARKKAAEEGKPILVWSGAGG